MGGHPPGTTSTPGTTRVHFPSRKHGAAIEGRENETRGCRDGGGLQAWEPLKTLTAPHKKSTHVTQTQGGGNASECVIL